MTGSRLVSTGVDFCELWDVTAMAGERVCITPTISPVGYVRLLRRRGLTWVVQWNGTCAMVEVDSPAPVTTHLWFRAPYPGHEAEPVVVGCLDAGEMLWCDPDWKKLQESATDGDSHSQ